jgi:hypothetical protein
MNCLFDKIVDRRFTSTNVPFVLGKLPVVYCYSLLVNQVYLVELIRLLKGSLLRQFTGKPVYYPSASLLPIFYW